MLEVHHLDENMAQFAFALSFLLHVVLLATAGRPELFDGESLALNS